MECSNKYRYKKKFRYEMQYKIYIVYYRFIVLFFLKKSLKFYYDGNDYFYL